MQLWNPHQISFNSFCVIRRQTYRQNLHTFFHKYLLCTNINQLKFYYIYWVSQYTFLVLLETVYTIFSSLNVQWSKYYETFLSEKNTIIFLSKTRLVNIMMHFRTFLENIYNYSCINSKRILNLIIKAYLFQVGSHEQCASRMMKT